ncbi:uncharacterized protein G2W53_028616 [Senna tora]|uniref:Uncharacterized protein n=1 Tax=Senna tora TaxID=362788 RepID=A0A834T3V1_9FABA|nr:uncharacterized protein G2W53_028616 [Senna tora]
MGENPGLIAMGESSRWIMTSEDFDRV